VYGSGSTYGVYGYGTSTGDRGVYGYAPYGYGGYFSNRTAGYWTCYVRNSLNTYPGLYVFGQFTVSGTKNFAQDHPTDPTKTIVYTCLEGPENGTYVRGSGRLTEGEAVIQLPSHFKLVTSETGLTAQVTPREECNGLYVVRVTPSEVEVREMAEGKSNAAFDFFVNGVRLGFEKHDTIQDRSKFAPPPEPDIPPPPHDENMEPEDPHRDAPK
jgi:hypothetical protein